MVFHLGKKKTARLFGAGGFSDSVDSSLAGPFRQQAGKVKEAEKEPVRHVFTIEAHAQPIWQLFRLAIGQISPSFGP
jgi:hypothetical protein